MDNYHCLHDVLGNECFHHNLMDHQLHNQLDHTENDGLLPMIMFSEKNMKKHIGDRIKFRDRLTTLKEVEAYFVKKCKTIRLEHSHDCTADENTYFKTLNYTTYAGMFVMHPLVYSTTVFQMLDAVADGKSDAGHIDWIRENIAANTMSKYTLASGAEFSTNAEYQSSENLAVLPGSNKFYQHVSKKKFEQICSKHGRDLILKPHPITNNEVLGQIFTSKKSALLADPHDSLYAFMQNAKHIYTTHISETALTALVMGKTIEPLDPFGVRLTGAFSHINHICFSYEQPLELLARAFASPKSGVICPAVDEDWKAKMDAYFDYILAMRKRQKGHYLE